MFPITPFIELRVVDSTYTKMIFEVELDQNAIMDSNA